MKDPYKRLSSEWGSKARKEDSRSAKSTLKQPTKEELADIEFNRVIEKLRIKMANPPDLCERCDEGMGEGGRQWTGTRWLCYTCAEET